MELDPFVPHVVRANRVLDRKQGRVLAVPQDHCAAGGDEKHAVEEEPGEFRLPCLSCSHQVAVELLRDLA